MNDSKAAYCGGILFGTTVMTGPNYEVSTRGDWRLRNPMVKKVSTEELHDMAANLISVAYASGQAIQIEHVSHPQYGMGGYMPTVKLRPHYGKVREAMDELQARRDGTAVPPRKLKSSDQPTLRLLKAREVPWNTGDSVLDNAIMEDPSYLPHETLVKLVREYDRRFMQLWDKIGFERQNELVDYSLLDLEKKPAEAPTPEPLLSALNDAIKDQREYFLSCFESRYDHGVIAMLSFDMQFPQVVQDYFQGGDDDDGFIRTLLQFDWYPIAAGKTTEEAIANLDAKMRKITFSKTTPLLIHWLDYVVVINDRIRSGNVYEIVHAQYEDAVENAYASGN